MEAARLEVQALTSAEPAIFLRLYIRILWNYESVYASIAVTVCEVKQITHDYVSQKIATPAKVDGAWQISYVDVEQVCNSNIEKYCVRRLSDSQKNRRRVTTELISLLHTVA
jgi:hypothetical protein